MDQERALSMTALPLEISAANQGFSDMIAQASAGLSLMLKREGLA
jgi:hypothetical protein